MAPDRPGRGVGDFRTQASMNATVEAKLRALLNRMDSKIIKTPQAKSHWVLVTGEDAEALRKLLSAGNVRQTAAG